MNTMNLSAGDLRTGAQPKSASFAVPGSASSETSLTVSWPAVFADAVAASALLLILLLLGTGLGLTLISSWSNQGASAKAIGI